MFTLRIQNKLLPGSAVAVVAVVGALLAGCSKEALSVVTNNQFSGNRRVTEH